MRYNKYKAKKTTVDDITFASKKEAKRYLELKMLEKLGMIEDLTLQPAFLLQGSFDYRGKKIRSISYVADFKYYDTAKKEEIIEDVKGIQTDVFKIKWKMAKCLNPQYLFITT